MKIEVYLQDKNQEFKEGEGQLLCWTKQKGGRPPFGKPASTGVPLKATNELSEIRYRQENFGGLLYNPGTLKIFKADEEALHVLKDLQEGKTLEELADKYNIPEKSIKNIITALVS